MIDASPPTTFIVFSVACLLAYLWATFLLPETANVSLEEMDAVFHSSAGYDDTILKHQVRLQVLIS